MSSKLVLMEEEAFKLLSNRLDKLATEVKKLNTQNNPGFKEKWLVSDEVCLQLNISKRTLQNIRDQKTIPFSKIGKKIYYKASDIEKYLENNLEE